MPVSCLVVTSRRSRDRKRDFQLQTTQMLEASCLFSFKSILLRTSGKCQSIKRTACMLNFIYIVQSKWYLRLKISVQGPFKSFSSLRMSTWKDFYLSCLKYFSNSIGSIRWEFFLFPNSLHPCPSPSIISKRQLYTSIYHDLCTSFDQGITTQSIFFSRHFLSLRSSVAQGII